MYVRRQTLGAAFLPPNGSGGGGGMIRSVSTGEAQKFSYPDNQCPRGYRQVGSGSDAPPRGYSKPWGDYVMCRPQPTAAAAPAQAPNIQTQVTVSPAIQTDVSPQISPAFFQAQDSPGATQAATPIQSKEGQQADTGGTGGNGAAAMLEVMRAQAELDRQRRQEEAAIREQERQRELQARLEAEQRRQAELERQREAERAERDAQAAELQAQYQAELEAHRRAADQPTAQAAVMPVPSQQFLPAGDSGEADEAAAAEASAGLPLPLIIGAVVAGGVVLYVIMRQRGKR